MSLAALLLVLLSAFLHALWNLLAKKAGDGGREFVCLVAWVSVLLWAPVAITVLVATGGEFGRLQLMFVLVSGVLHLSYFLLLQRGYATGDLSLVYPLARGTGPTLATVAAIAFLGEHPSGLALAGAALVAFGVFVVGLGAGHSLSPHRTRDSFTYGLLAGVFIAGYTIWDKTALTYSSVFPLVLVVAGDAVRGTALLPFARRGKLSLIWKRNKREILGVAFLSPLAYLLVLLALRTAPVSYVAPVREIGILVGVVLGVRNLAEGHGRRRVAAALLIVAGVVALALG